MLDFIKKFFNPEPSRVTARERLRLVLLSDHLALAPDVVESLKTDLIAVISKYVDVDVANCDVTFEQQERQVAMLANIPILGMKPPVRVPPPPVQSAPIDAAPASIAIEDPPALELPAVAAETVAPTPKPARRRRRRRPAQPASAAG